MSEMRSAEGGCGCASFIVTVFLLTALWASLPTPWGKLEIDLLPPAIRLEK